MGLLDGRESLRQKTKDETDKTDWTEGIEALGGKLPTFPLPHQNVNVNGFVLSGFLLHFILLWLCLFSFFFPPPSIIFFFLLFTLLFFIPKSLFL